MATVRACDHCGDSYTAQRSDSRYCSSSCRSKATLARKRGPQASVVTMPGATGPGTIEAAVRTQLGSQLDTVVGRQAVAPLPGVIARPEGAWQSPSTEPTTDADEPTGSKS